MAVRRPTERLKGTNASAKGGGARALTKLTHTGSVSDTCAALGHTTRCDHRAANLRETGGVLGTLDPSIEGIASLERVIKGGCILDVTFRGEHPFRQGPHARVWFMGAADKK